MKVFRNEGPNKGIVHIFDETDPDFTPDCDEYNTMFIKCAEDRANDLLKCDGYLFLKDISLSTNAIASMYAWVKHDKPIEFNVYVQENRYLIEFVGLEKIFDINPNVSLPAEFHEQKTGEIVYV